MMSVARGGDVDLAQICTSRPTRFREEPNYIFINKMTLMLLHNKNGPDATVGKVPFSHRLVGFGQHVKFDSPRRPLLGRLSVSGFGVGVKHELAGRRVLSSSNLRSGHRGQDVPIHSS
jgi:hypothetical protein